MSRFSEDNTSLRRRAFQITIYAFATKTRQHRVAGEGEALDSKLFENQIYKNKIAAP